jgi:glycolate oxidase FAD binding subunit
VDVDPFAVPTVLHRPAAVLWDGTSTWVCLEGHPADVDAQAALLAGAAEVEGPPLLPTGSRRSLPPTALRELTGTFVAEVGVGVVHHADPWPERPTPAAGVLALNRTVKQLFDPAGRLNPGVDVVEAA